MNANVFPKSVKEKKIITGLYLNRNVGNKLRLPIYC